MKAPSPWRFATCLMLAIGSLHAQEARVEGSGFRGSDFDGTGDSSSFVNVVSLDAYSLLGRYLDPANQFYAAARVAARGGLLGVELRPDATGYTGRISSRAVYSDNLTFSTAGTVTLRTRVLGEVFSGGGSARGNLTYSVEMGTASGQRGGQGNLSFSTQLPSGLTLTELNCSGSFTCSPSSAFGGLPSFDVAFAFNVLPFTPYRMSADLSAQGFNNMAILFNNTAAISFDLPSGMTMSSASGVFLTPVPEPSALALMAGGLGLVAWQTARRRTGQRRHKPTANGPAGPA
jgi:hypothetical protein